MNPLQDLRGIVTVLNTPFTESDALDLPALAANVRYAARAGVRGFLAPAMASEVYALREDERRMLLETMRGEAPNLALIGGASARTHAESLRHAEECIAAGCDGVLVSIGPEESAGLAARLQDLAALRPGFIMLQDWDAEGGGLPDATILAAFEKVDALKCVKIEVVNAGEKYTRLLKATGGALHVSGGWAVTQMIDGLERGVHAFMPTGLHATYARIYSLFAGGEKARAEELFAQLSPILEFSNQDLDTSILFFKHLLHRQGVYNTPRVRPPIEPWDADELADAVPMLDAAIALETGQLAALGLRAT